MASTRLTSHSASRVVLSSVVAVIPVISLLLGSRWRRVGVALNFAGWAAVATGAVVIPASGQMLIKGRYMAVTELLPFAGCPGPMQ